MDRLLEELQSAGQHDSQGQFTLELERALELLARYQLRDPHNFVLRLAACAASRPQVKSEGLDLVVTFDGEPFSAAELEQVFPALLRAESGRLADLGVALNGALRLGSKVEFRSAGSLLRLEAGRLSVERAPESALNVLRVRGSWRQRLGGTAGKLAALVHSRCRFGRLGRFACLHADLVCRVGAAPLPARGRFERSRSGWGETTALLCLGERSLGEGLRVVHRGVELAAPQSLEYPGALALVWCDDLPLDLSREELHDGPQLGELVERVKAEFDALAVEGHELLSEELLLAAARRGAPGFDRLPLLRRADGQSATLEEARLRYARDGYLGAGNVSPRAFQLEPRTRVLLQQCFPHQVEIEAKTLHRLSGGPYLVRVPSAPKGEVGIPVERAPLAPPVPRAQRAGPPPQPSVPWGTPSPADLHSAFRALAEVELPGPLAAAARSHLLEYLVWISRDQLNSYRRVAERVRWGELSLLDLLGGAPLPPMPPDELACVLFLRDGTDHPAPQRPLLFSSDLLRRIAGLPADRVTSLDLARCLQVPAPHDPEPGLHRWSEPATAVLEAAGTLAGDAPLASEHLARALALTPSPARPWMEKAAFFKLQELALGRQWEKAQTLARETVELYPELREQIALILDDEAGTAGVDVGVVGGPD